jgi:hypothetical protein
LKIKYFIVCLIEIKLDWYDRLTLNFNNSGSWLGFKWSKLGLPISPVKCEWPDFFFIFFNKFKNYEVNLSIIGLIYFLYSPYLYEIFLGGITIYSHGLFLNILWDIYIHTHIEYLLTVLCEIVIYSLYLYKIIFNFLIIYIKIKKESN